MKLHPVYWILAAVMTAGGIGLMTAGAAKMHDERKANVYSEEKTVEVGEGYGLDIRLSAGNLVLTASESQELCEISRENIPKGVEIYEEDGVLHIVNEFNWTSLWTNGFTRINAGKVTVALPDYVYDSVNIDLGAGNGSVTGIDCRKLEIDCGAGDASLSDSTAKEGIFDCGAGEFTGERLDFDALRISCGMGSNTLRDSKAGDLIVEIGAGDALLSGVDVKGGAQFSLGMGDLSTDGMQVGGRTVIDAGAGSCTMQDGSFAEDVTCELGAGDLEILDSTLRGDLEIESAAGDVTLSLREEADAFDVDCSDVVGDVNIGDKHTKSMSSSHADHKITVEGMGDVEIRFTGE